jgi:hypothetical protein
MKTGTDVGLVPHDRVDASPDKKSRSTPCADGGTTYTGLHAFERDLLLAIRTLEHDCNRPPTGVEVHAELRELYDQPVHHSRVYQNLSELVDRGVVEKGQLDNRTNTYATTPLARELLVDRVERMARQLGVLERGES